MSKAQVLRESKIRLHKSDTGKRQSQIRSVILGNSEAPRQVLGTLNEAEREILRQQVRQALIKERRRANARSWTYDMGRHISLYLMAKSLALATK